jgi:hypothetical protein
MSMARWFAWAFVVFAIVYPAEASAYPWMLRHEYNACAQCHVDPSGAGPLTKYGRALGEVALRTRYGAEADQVDDPGAAAKFLWGAVPLPEWLDLGGAFRVAHLSRKDEDLPIDHRLVYMQAELSASVQASRFVASGSLGYLPQGGLLSSLTHGTQDNVISRYHWVGYRLDEDSTMLVRAGRMNVPFGIRDTDHTLWIRTLSRTNIDDAQQHGASFSYSGEKFRGELMGILGNFQTRPDSYRERGYSGYLEWTPMTRLGTGISSRITHVSLDPQVGRAAFRHAHGAFVRWATPWEPLVLMSETDYIIESFEGPPRRQGIVTMLQADLEPIQGLHYRMTGELQHYGPHEDASTSYGLWATFQWFCASHVDLRLDGIYRSLGSPTGSFGVTTLLVQAHLYL